MENDPRTSDDAEKDLYPPDTAFGRAAARDQDRAEQGEEAPEGEEAPRPAGKAEPASDLDDEVDEASEESFPASDPPSSTGTVAGQ